MRLLIQLCSLEEIPSAAVDWVRMFLFSFERKNSWTKKRRTGNHVGVVDQFQSNQTKILVSFFTLILTTLSS